MDQLIEFYFELSIKYADIVLLLNDKHAYEISESKIKRILEWQDSLKESITVICMMQGGREHKSIARECKRGNAKVAKK